MSQVEHFFEKIINISVLDWLDISTMGYLLTFRNSLPDVSIFCFMYRIYSN